MATPLPPINAVRGSKIAHRQVDNLHALIVAINNPTTICYLLVWTNAEDTRLLEIPNWLPWELTQPCVEFVGNDRVVITAMTGGNIRVVEFVLGEAGLTATGIDFTFGTSASRSGSSLRLANGGTFIAASVHNEFSGIGPFLRLDVAYRPPPVPFFGGEPANPYTVTHYDLPSGALSSSPSFIQLVEAKDGVIHLFWVSDSYGKVGRARFTATGQLVDVEPAFLASGSLSPSVEFPRLVAMRDADRILLAYQNVPHSDHKNCSAALENKTVLSSRTVIAAVYPDDHREQVALLDWPSYHKSAPWPCIWPRRSGGEVLIYFYNEWLNPDACSLTWRAGVLQEGGEMGFVDVGEGKIEAWSDDGWIMFAGRMGDNAQLRKVNFEPTLTIERWSTQAQVVTEFRVTWDNARPGQQLESSADLVTWTDVPGATAPPVIVPNAGGQQFFRVRETP